MSLALLVPGGTGQLGRELAASAPVGAEVHAPGSAELDVTNVGAVVEAVKTFAGTATLPPVVVNAAAYTAVDAAESDAGRAFTVNADGPRVLAAACSAHGVPLIHVSTDYVFPGDADSPYRTDAELGPRCVYGVTKAAGEDAVLRSGARAWVVRTAWVYGAHGANFVKTMARLSTTDDTVSVVDDQCGSPTWTRDLAAGLLELAGLVAGGKEPPPVLHATGGGETTWYEFARAVFTELGADPARVRPGRTEDRPRPAPRPAYSVLSGEEWRSAGLTPLRSWREALAAAFAEDGDAFRG
ncbi:dTDP-4-dehydrorhamnose reductase [Actinophytocola sp.]|uniref:dTDP-4-dehydrorhamnose reductase n=1 Tax=Actinophytocola sp. TaxID=1872138 RepID=UPI003D6A8016